MKSHFLIIFAILLIITKFTYAQEFTIIGAGTRARSMGGAYIGIADDVTAIFWNPGGLAQIEKGEISLSMAHVNYWISKKNNDFKTDLWTNSYFVHNFFSCASPYFIGGAYRVKKFIVALGFQTIMYYYSKYEDNDFLKERKSYVYMISPSLGYQLSKKFSCGLTLSHFKGKNEFNFRYKKEKENIRDKYRDEGINLNFGLLYNQKLFRVGTVIRWPIRLRYADSVRDYNEIVYLPLTFGVGGSFKPLDYLILSVDFEIKKCSELYRKYEKAFGQNDSKEMDDLNYLHQLRIGSEVRFKVKNQIRWGMTYLPTIFRDIDDEQIKGSIYTIGYGRKFGNLWVDTGLECCRFKYNIPDNGNYSENYLSILTSIAYHFDNQLPLP